MAARHLVLIGLMGAGKTTVGERCAELLHRPFLDTDQLVEANTRMGVADIFRHHGEQQFRVLERDAVADACASPEPLVIACGGGAVLDPENRRRLRACGLVVWLRASPAVLGTRVETGVDRPLLAGAAPPLATLERLSAQREPAYEAAAEVQVDTEDRSVDEVAAAVVEEYASWNG
ncbi:MAG TPA: shikimate kinase [Acidimicrobiia bacterium]|jgi:shikimate kinase|nr:shikimate kinase [Acidimicrobiia bacterium]